MMLDEGFHTVQTQSERHIHVNAYARLVTVSNTWETGNTTRTTQPALNGCYLVQVSEHYRKRLRESYSTVGDDMSKARGNSPWPPRGTPLTEEQILQLHELAVCDEGKNNGIRLLRLKNSDVDFELMKEVISDAKRLATEYPQLTSNPQAPFTIKVDYNVSDDVYAQIRAKDNGKNIITLNGIAFRNKAVLENDYAKLADKGHFVRGTTYRAIIYHEVGEVLYQKLKISAFGIAAKTLGMETSDMVLFIEQHISVYASILENDLFSEVFAGAWTGVKNVELLTLFREFAKLLMR